MGIPLKKFFHYAFDAGENKGEAPTFFSKSELDRSFNVENRGNGLTTRKGSVVLNVDGSGYPNPIAANPDITSIFNFTYSTSSVEVLYTGGGSIYRSVATPTALKTGLTSGLRFQGQKAGNVFYLTNGTDAVQYYDPARSTTQTYTAGYDTPGTFTATPGAAGSMANGTYEYYVTWYDSNTDTESNRQAATVSAVVVAGPNGSVALTLLPIDAEARTTHWRIYRKDPAGFYHYRLASVAYNAGAPNYTDTAAATGTTFVAPNDNDRPDESTAICLHGNIMVYATGNVVTWSKNYRYQNVPTFNRETFDDNSRSIGKLVSFRDVLVVFKTDSIYIISGDLNRGDYRVKRISGYVGTLSPATVKESPNGIFFLDNQRKPRFINSTDFESDDLREHTDISYKYRRKFAEVDQSALANCHAEMWESSDVSQYRLFVPVSAYTASKYPNHCFVYDYGLAQRNGGDSAWFDFRYNINMVCSTVVTTNASGDRSLYVGDDYGLLWNTEVTDTYFDGAQFFRAESAGTITIGATTINISTAAMGVNQFRGMYLFLYNAYTYDVIYQSRVTSNTATQFTLEDTIPALATDNPAVTVGGYLVFFATSHYTHDRAGRNRPFKASVLFSTEFVESNVQFFTHYDFNEAFNYTYSYINTPANPSLTPLADNYTLVAGSTLALYDTAIYDAATYGIALYGTDEFLLRSKYYFNHVSWGCITREPDQPFAYLGATLYYQPKGLMT